MSRARCGPPRIRRRELGGGAPSVANALSPRGLSRAPAAVEELRRRAEPSRAPPAHDDLDDFAIDYQSRSHPGRPPGAESRAEAYGTTPACNAKATSAPPRLPPREARGARRDTGHRPLRR